MRIDPASIAGTLDGMHTIRLDDGRVYWMVFSTNDDGTPLTNHPFWKGHTINDTARVLMRPEGLIEVNNLVIGWITTSPPWKRCAHLIAVLDPKDPMRILSWGIYSSQYDASLYQCFSSIFHSAYAPTFEDAKRHLLVELGFDPMYANILPLVKGA